MAPKKRAAPLPVTPGLVTPGGQQQDSGAPAAEGKKWFKRGKRGKRDLLRAVADRKKKEEANFGLLMEDPNEGEKKFEEYPSDGFLQDAEGFFVARYANFLLQSVMLLVRVFQPPPDIATRFGQGLATSARMALLLMRSGELTNPAALRVRSLKRHLYGRMLAEQENRAVVEKVLETEWDEDRLSAVGERVDEYLENTIAPKIVAGALPKSNLVFDMEAQWSGVWEVPRFHANSSTTCVSRCFIFGMHVLCVREFDAPSAVLCFVCDSCDLGRASFRTTVAFSWRVLLRSVSWMQKQRAGGDRQVTNAWPAMLGGGAADD